MNDHAFIPRLTWRWATPAELPRNDEDTLILLLGGIAETGSIAQAAKRCRFSYRHAWGLVRHWEAQLGSPLVDMARGRGSTLAPLGLQLVRLDARIRSRLAVQLASAADEARRELAHFLFAPTRLIMHASHDPLLVRLPELLRPAGADIEMHVMGSLESLVALSDGRCEIAGFHCPQGELGESVWPLFRAHLDSSAHVLIRFACRAQGLMVAPGNPLGIAGLGDLAVPGRRFVNRQPGSGTRILLDLLLGAAGLAPEAVAGYGDEEFTHAAVAAIIASGGADSGLGVGAAARRFGLEFIPLATEDYFLALRRETLQCPPGKALLALLESPEWRAEAAGNADYDVGASGTPIDIDSLPGERRRHRHA